MSHKMWPQTRSLLLANVLPMFVVMATVTMVSEAHDHQFICNKKQTTAGSKLISVIQTDGRKHCRDACTGSCEVAVFDSATRKCKTYSDIYDFLTLTSKESSTVMVKDASTDMSCDSTYNCYHGKSEDYQGTLNTTQGGFVCQSWASQTPHAHDKYTTASEFRDNQLPDNFCRSAVGESYAPWCYTTSPEVRWDYCGVTQCAKDCCANDAEEERLEFIELRLLSLNTFTNNTGTDIKSLQTEKAGLKDHLNTLQGDINTQAKDISALQSAKTSSDGKMTSMEKSIAAIQKEIAALQKAKLSGDAQISALHAARQDHEQQMDSIKSELATLKTSIQTPSLVARSNCKWTNYVNSWDARLKFTAPGKSVIVGTESYHDNRREDRRWKFFYCELTA